MRHAPTHGSARCELRYSVLDTPQRTCGMTLDSESPLRFRHAFRLLPRTRGRADSTHTLTRRWCIPRSMPDDRRSIKNPVRRAAEVLAQQVIKSSDQPQKSPRCAPSRPARCHARDGAPAAVEAPHNTVLSTAQRALSRRCPSLLSFVLASVVSRSLFGGADAHFGGGRLRLGPPMELAPSVWSPRVEPEQEARRECGCRCCTVGQKVEMEALDRRCK